MGGFPLTLRSSWASSTHGMAFGRTALEIEIMLIRQICWDCFEVLLRATMSLKVSRDEKIWIDSSGGSPDGDMGGMLAEI